MLPLPKSTLLRTGVSAAALALALALGAEAASDLSTEGFEIAAEQSPASDRHKRRNDVYLVILPT
jgi:hypothetical protein